MEQEQFELWAQHVAAEVRRAGNVKFTLELSPAEALYLCASLQLALRHPGNIGAAAALARQIIDTLREAVRAHGCELLAQMIEAGDDPAQDTPREERSPSQIVQPRAEGAAS